MCRLLRVSRGGFYQWVRKPLSDKAQEDRRLLELIRHSYHASSGVYDYRRVLGRFAIAFATASLPKSTTRTNPPRRKPFGRGKAPAKIVDVKHYD